MTQSQGPQDAPAHQGIPQAPPVPEGYGYGSPQPMAVPPGMYVEPRTGLLLPQGVELASIGRRIGAYFLSALLVIVTLVIGFIIWGLIGWGKGRSPAFQVLGMRCWKVSDGRVAGVGTMALRDIVGYIVQSLFIMPLVSFILFLSTNKRQSLMDMIGGTVVLYDPNKVLDNWQA